MQIASIEPDQTELGAKKEELYQVRLYRTCIIWRSLFCLKWLLSGVFFRALLNGNSRWRQAWKLYERLIPATVDVLFEGRACLIATPIIWGKCCYGERANELSCWFLTPDPVAGHGHQWKKVKPRINSCCWSKRRQRSNNTTSSSSNDSKERLAIGSFVRGHKRSAGCNSGE